VLAILGYARAMTWRLAPVIGISVAISVLIVVCLSALLGAMLPFMFKRMRLDPAVISSPLLAQVIDILGVLIFYNVAYRLVQYFSLGVAAG